MNPELLAGVEAGGTKFVCGLGRGPRDILRRHVVPTTTPEETLDGVAAFFREAKQALGPVRSAGVAGFGPLILDPASVDYGHIGETPKPGWSGYDLRGALAAALNCRVGIDTDVAGAGLAEAAYGAGAGLDSLAYVTVGTGIGGALILRGAPMHTVSHPEMGHIALKRHPLDTDFPGVCPFHGDCAEGLASGPAVVARHGRRLGDMPQDAPIWTLMADYLAQLLGAIQLIGAPQRIVVGGGVMSNTALYGLVHRAFHQRNNGYMPGARRLADVQNFITAPGLGDQAGLVGALLLAERADTGFGLVQN